MVAVAEAHPDVGIVGAYRLDDVWVNLDGLPVDREVFSGREICRRCLLGGPYLTGSPTSTMIRADLVRERYDFYDETLISADTDACYRIFCEHEVGWVHQVLTYTRRHGATMSTYAHRVRSYASENMRSLVRHGPRVMEREMYRRRLRAELARYAWFLAKQHVRGRTRQEEFRAFHLMNLRLLEEEAQGDREVTLASQGFRRFLDLREAPRAR
jgi:hypothetical protein